MPQGILTPLLDTSQKHVESARAVFFKVDVRFKNTARLPMRLRKALTPCPTGAPDHSQSQTIDEVAHSIVTHTLQDRKISSGRTVMFGIATASRLGQRSYRILPM